MAIGREATQARKIAIVALPGAEALEVAGLFDVFRRAELFGMKLRATYDTNVYGVRRGAINKAKGLTLSTASDYKAAKAVDTLLVVSGFETPSIPLAPSFLRWLRYIASREANLRSLRGRIRTGGGRITQRPQSCLSLGAR